MGEAEERSLASWRQLDAEWGRAQVLWRDTTTMFFARHQWSPMHAETVAYQAALHRLTEILRAAQQEADRY